MFEHEGKTLVANPATRISETKSLTNGNRFAEMKESEKNIISHRARALARLKAWFESNSNSP